MAKLVHAKFLIVRHILIINCLNYAYHYDLGSVTTPSKMFEPRVLGINISKASRLTFSVLKQRQAPVHTAPLGFFAL
jgi:hypothetical protein